MADLNEVYKTINKSNEEMNKMDLGIKVTRQICNKKKFESPVKRKLKKLQTNLAF